MSQMSNLVAFDGATTPVAHTFVPQSVTREAGVITAVYKEAIATVPDIAQGTVQLTLKKLASGIYRVTSRVAIPVMEATNGSNSSGYTAPPKVAYVDTVESIGYFSERGTIAGRRLVRQLSTNIMNGVSTTVAPVITGPVAELMDLLTVPN